MAACQLPKPPGTDWASHPSAFTQGTAVQGGAHAIGTSILKVTSERTQQCFLHAPAECCQLPQLGASPRSGTLAYAPVIKLPGPGPEKIAPSVKQLPEKQEDVNFIPTAHDKKSQVCGTHL